MRGGDSEAEEAEGEVAVAVVQEEEEEEEEEGFVTEVKEVIQGESRTLHEIARHRSASSRSSSSSSPNLTQSIRLQRHQIS